MSQVCMVIMDKNSLDTCALNQIIDNIVPHLCFDIFLVTEHTALFLQEMNCDDKLILSFADDAQFDNCEMLLLPDGCFFGGYPNEIVFEDRMKQIETFLTIILNWTGTVELFVGYCGSYLHEYKHCNIHIKDFINSTKSLNSIAAPNLHLTIYAD